MLKCLGEQTVAQNARKLNQYATATLIKSIRSEEIPLVKCKSLIHYCILIQVTRTDLCGLAIVFWLWKLILLLLRYECA